MVLNLKRFTRCFSNSWCCDDYLFSMACSILRLQGEQQQTDGMGWACIRVINSGNVSISNEKWQSQKILVQVLHQLSGYPNILTILDNNSLKHSPSYHFWRKLKLQSICEDIPAGWECWRTNCGETKPGFFFPPQHIVVCPFLSVFKLQPLSTAAAGG